MLLSTYDNLLHIHLSEKQTIGLSSLSLLYLVAFLLGRSFQVDKLTLDAVVIE
jgi:hypothetical protein